MGIKRTGQDAARVNIKFLDLYRMFMSACQ